MSKRAEESAIETYPVVIEEHTERDLNKPRRLSYINGYEQAEKDTIERVCDWLESHLPIIVNYYDEDIHEDAYRDEFIDMFRIQMEEE